MRYREPPIITVLRHLMRAVDVARKRRVRADMMHVLEFALRRVLEEIDRQEKKGRRK